MSGRKKGDDDDKKQDASPEEKLTGNGAAEAGSDSGTAGGNASSSEHQGADVSLAKPKDHKHHDHSTEAEVDRIIDAQDNEYILSKPKCAPADHPPFCAVALRTCSYAASLSCLN